MASFMTRDFNAPAPGHYFDKVSRKDALDYCKMVHNQMGGTWLEALYEVQIRLKRQKYLSFLIARARTAEFNERKARRVERQARWDAHVERINGGYVKEYLAKHGKFGGSTKFLSGLLYRALGMTVQQGRPFPYPEVEEPQYHVVRRFKPTFVACGSWEDDVEYGPRVAPEQPRQRSWWLLARLRAIIRALRSRDDEQMELIRRSMHAPPPVESPYKSTICHNMDEGPQGDDGISLEKSSNVIITNQQGASVASEQSTSVSPSMCSSDLNNSYNELVNREIAFDTFVWATTNAYNTSIKSYNFPIDFVKKMQGSPNVVPFLFNRYFRGDINVRVQVNSNKFMTGQLQVAWYYQAENDQGLNNRDNVATNSQTLHTLVNAGTSNEAVLTIPYNNFKPFLEVGYRDDKDSNLYLGKLIIRVLNVLSATSQTDNECSVTVFVSFSNCIFTGYLNSALNNVTKISHNMEFVAAAAGAKLMEAAIDLNRDKPTVSAKPSYVALQPAQSWCHGTNVSEDTFDLRLLRADVPHGSNYADSEFTVNSVAQRFGYICKRTWNAQSRVGAKIFAIEAAPMIEETTYFCWNNQTENEYVYALPPVAVVSNMYQYWRGSLVLRLDFVATRFHTGRLLVAYIPGNYRDDVTLDQAKSSTNAVFDLETSQQMNFRIPYVSDKYFWPRKLDLQRVGSDTYAPGYVYVFVLNNLVPMASIPNVIEFNVYMKGGEDFEVMVPAQPTIGLSFNPKHITPAVASAHALDGYFPYYTGTYVNLDINNQAYSEGQSFAIFRYGTGYQHVAQFGLPEKPSYGVPDIPNKSYYLKSKVSWCKLRESQKGPQTVVVDHFIPWYDGDYIYVLPCKSKDLAVEWCTKMNANNGDYSKFLSTSLRPDKYFYPYWNDDADDWCQGNPIYEETPVQASVDGFEFVQHNMDSRIDLSTPLLDTTGTVPSTNHGASLIGEGHGDFKDLCRRYQPYATVAIARKIMSSKPGTVLFSFPVMPQGLALNVGTTTSTLEFANRCRDGIIPILLSGYRFFRGSIRFRISCPEINGVFFIQHVPHAPLVSQGITIRDGSVRSISDLYNHGYAYTIMSRSTNGILSFEVPFYLNVDSMLLQKPKLADNGKIHLQDINYACSLGEIRIGIGNVPKGILDYNDFSIFYSLGDDARPSVFQGFVPMVLTQDVPPAFTVQHNGLANLFGSQATKTLDIVSKKMEDIKDLDFNKASEAAFETLSTLTDTSKKASAAIEKFDSLSDTASLAFTTFIDNLRSHGASAVIISAFTNIAHVINNPEPSTCAIAFGSFLISLGVLCVERLSEVVKLATRIFEALRPQRLNGENAKPNVCHNSEFDNKDIVALTSVIYSGVSAALNVRGATLSPHNKKTFSENLFNGVAVGCKDGSYFFRFLVNVIDVIIKMFNKLKRWVMPSVSGLETLMEDSELILKWSEEAMLLTEPGMEKQFDLQPLLANRLHACYIVGSLVCARFVNLPRSVNVTFLKDLYAKVCALKTVLEDKGICSIIRREPFIVWIAGEPGVGKSHMAPKNIINMLRAAHVPITGSPIYTHPAGAKYWENVNQEPAMLMDDVLVLKEGEAAESELSTLMQLKSSALFTPPIAECDRKKKRYAPELIYMQANHEFPPITQMHCAEAIYRRRDLLWQCMLRPPRTKIDEFTAEELDDVDHLVFRYHCKPSDASLPNPWSGWMNYDEFNTMNIAKFVEFRNKQILSHAKKIDYLNDSIKEIITDPKLVTMPLKEILESYVNNKIFVGMQAYSERARDLLGDINVEHNGDDDKATSDDMQEFATFMAENVNPEAMLVEPMNVPPPTLSVDEVVAIVANATPAPDESGDAAVVDLNEILVDTSVPPPSICPPDVAMLEKYKRGFTKEEKNARYRQGVEQRDILYKSGETPDTDRIYMDYLLDKKVSMVFRKWVHNNVIPCLHEMRSLSDKETVDKFRFDTATPIILPIFHKAIESDLFQQFLVAHSAFSHDLEAMFFLDFLNNRQAQYHQSTLVNMDNPWLFFEALTYSRLRQKKDFYSKFSPENIIGDKSGLRDGTFARWVRNATFSQLTESQLGLREDLAEQNERIRIFNNCPDYTQFTAFFDLCKLTVKRSCDLKEVEEEIRRRTAIEMKGMASSIPIEPIVSITENGDRIDVSVTKLLSLEELKAAAAKLDPEDVSPPIIACNELMTYKEVVDFQYPTKICTNHAKLFFERLEGEKVAEGLELLGKPVKFKDWKELFNQVNIYMLSKPVTHKLCRHVSLLLFDRTYVRDTGCCIKPNDSGENYPHFCIPILDSVKCDGPACFCYSKVPISANKPCSYCFIHSKALYSSCKALMFRKFPSMFDNQHKDNNDCPEIFKFAGLSLRIRQGYSTIRECFRSIKKFISWIWDKMMGAARKVFDFISEHKGMIFAACAIVTTIIAWMKRDELKSVSLTYWNEEQKIDKYVKGPLIDVKSKIANVFSRGVPPIPEDVRTGVLESPTHNIIASGDQRVFNRDARTVFKAKTLSNPNFVKSHILHNIDHSDVVADRIVANTVILVAYSIANGSVVESDHRSIRALALGDRFFVTVRHAWEIFNSFGHKVIRMFVKERLVEVAIADIEYSYLESESNSSLVILKMPLTCPQFKSIIPFLASESDHALRTPSFGTIVVLDKNVRMKDLPISIRESPLHIDACPGASAISIANTYHYPAMGFGICGSVVCDWNLGSPIFAMHIAGDEITKLGWGEPLVRETFEQLFDNRLIQIRAEPSFLPVEQAKIDLDTTIYPVGYAGKYAHHSPRDSAIHNSLIHGYITPTTAPAPLSASDPRLPPGNSPLVRGCEKHGILTKNFKMADIERAAQRLFQNLFVHNKPLRQQSILTDSQCVVGDPQLPYCDPLTWNSSEGYPFYKMRPSNASNKKWLFKLTESSTGLVFNGYNELLGRILSYKREQRNLGIPQPTIFTDCLKDARIPIGKCSIPGKTRIFSMSPVDYTIEFRKYCYDFIAAFQTNRVFNFNMIGMNVFGEDWHTLALNLNTHPNICTGDYSNFGPGLNEIVAKACCDLIEEWYDTFFPDEPNEWKRTRACLLEELICCYHLCNDLFYTVVAGIPSGSPITVVLNSLVNIMYLFVAWDNLSQSWPPHLRNFQEFGRNVILYTYGDDFIFSVSDKYKDLYNSSTIGAFLKEYDIIMTDAFKGDTITPYTTLDQASFLKGQFKFFLGRYWYALAVNQVEDIPNFINTKVKIVEATIENAEMALIHAHGHGSNYFDRFKEKLVNAFAEKGVVFHGRTFCEITDIKMRGLEDPFARVLIGRMI